MKLYYEIHGARLDHKSDLPIVFLNGLTLDTSSWIPVRPFIEPHFQCVFYDARGQGKSPKPVADGYPNSSHVEDLNQLLDELKIPKAHLVGLSNGGAIASLFAAQFPDRVGKLILSNSFARGDQNLRWTLESWLWANQQIEGASGRTRVTLPLLFGPEFADRNPQILNELLARSQTLDSQVIARLIQGPYNHDATRALSNIKAPTLVLAGEKDRLLPPWYSAELHGLIPQSIFSIIENVGHIPPLENPKLFSNYLLEFLKPSAQAEQGDLWASVT